MKSQYLGNRVTVEGTIIKTNTQYPFCTNAVFHCKRCDYKFSVKQKSLKMKEPIECENDTCRKKGFLEFVFEESTFIDAKEIEIYDTASDVIDPYGEPPKVFLKVILIGNTAGMAFLNKKYHFTGKFAISELGKKLEYMLFADIVEETYNLENQRDKIRAIRNLIQLIEKNHGKEGAPLEELYIEANTRYAINRLTVDYLINKMKQGGDLLSPDQKHIRLVN